LISNSQSKTKTSQILFQNKKKKTNNQQQLLDIDHQKQLALQKLLADSRIESNLIIVSKYNDNEDLGKRKRDDE
jgi:hypothetical protein